MKTVLFACIHTAGRSQMAAAWFNARANPEPLVWEGWARGSSTSPTA